MQLRIGNMPSGVREEEIGELVREYCQIGGIKIIEEGNPDKVMAYVHVELDRVGANTVAAKIQGRLWKERRLQTYVPLFGDDE